MTDREYLRSLGFTVGERGRFSKEMLEALAKRDRDDVIEEINDLRRKMDLPTMSPTREPQELYGYALSGARIGFIICSACANHMMWCECPNGVMAPDNVSILDGAAKDIAILHPRMIHLTSIA